jgi:hypothetical protein
MDWDRDDAGEWTALLDEGRRYWIRGGPGAWWFELVNGGGVVLATGRVWGDPAGAKAEADRRELSSWT